MPEPDDNPPLAQPAPGVHPLTYRSAGAVPQRAGLVTGGSLLNVDTARLVTAVLEAEGIESHLFNESSQALGIGAFGYTASEIQVPSLDAERAKAIVRQLIEDPDAIEPAEGADAEALQGED